MRSARLLAALAAFAVPAAVYVAAAPIEPASWDTAELQGVPYILGISHPTGFPFYVLLGYVWSHAFAFGSVAWRMNAMSAVAMGAASAAAYGAALEFGASLPVALLATFWFALTQNVWAHAIRAEAQDLAVACCAVALYAALRWMHGASDRWLLAAFALCGLGMAAHPNALWILPALVLAGVLAWPRPRLSTAAGCAALVLAGLALYVYLPLRSSYVVAHHLNPAAVLPGASDIFWNYNDPSTPRGLALELTGSETQTPGYFFASFNPLHVQSALWTFVETVHAQYGTVAMLLIVGGFISAWRRDWRAALVVTLACTAALLFSVVYPNESDVGRYRMLVSWLAVPLLGALTPHAKRRAAASWHAALALFLAIGGAWAFVHQWSFFEHRTADGGRWVIRAVRPYVPPGSAIVTGWLDATSLAYGAYVDGSLPGRIVVSDDRLDVPLYRGWARARRIFVLVNPQSVGAVPGATDYARLDPYHELYEVQPYRP